MAMALAPDAASRQQLCLNFTQALGDYIGASGIMSTAVYISYMAFCETLKKPLPADVSVPNKVDVLIAMQKLNDMIKKSADQWLKEEPITDIISNRPDEALMTEVKAIAPPDPPGRGPKY